MPKIRSAMTQRLKKIYTMPLVCICRHQKAPLYFASMKKTRFMHVKHSYFIGQFRALRLLLFA